MLRDLVAAGLVVALTATAQAQQRGPGQPGASNAGSLGDCAKVEDRDRRLACYDQASGREAAPTTIATPSAAAPGAEVRWSGNGITTTRPFHMDGPWEIQWDGRGDFFSAYLHRKGEVEGQAMPNIVANQMGRGTGSSYVPSAGDFYLVVNAIGPWTAKGVSLRE